MFEVSGLLAFDGFDLTEDSFRDYQGCDGGGGPHGGKVDDVAGDLGQQVAGAGHVG